ncbi:MAG: flagellar hook-associated protein FlgL [Ignavibacteriales bacterium]|nr:flagellar hook-associated protein FlgL [Ignavibacteriales bacterium]
MRVTENNIVSSLLLNINSSREQITKLQSQLASGKRVLKPSDDPQAADSILRLQAVIDRNEQYLKNVADGQAVLAETSTVLDGFMSIMQDVKSELINASNGSRQEALPVQANRLDQLLTQAVEIANTKFNGKYIFAGTNTLEAPFVLAADHSTVTANPNGITGSINYDVAEGSTQTVNMDGQEAFQGAQFFTTVIQLRDKLASSQFPAIGDVESVTAIIDYVLGKASKAGSISQGMDAMQIHLDEQQTQLRGLLSIDQDADVAQAALQLKQNELMLDAALNTGARILPKSLLDFLR